MSVERPAADRRQSPIVDHRDRDGHPVELVYLNQSDTSRFVPSAVRCRICDTQLGPADGETRIDRHFRNSPACRKAILAWLDARLEARRAGDDDAV